MLARHQTNQEEREIEIHVQWNHAEYELEKQKIIAESERERCTICNSSNVPIKLKLQPYEHKKEYTLTYLGEFQSII